MNFGIKGIFKMPRSSGTLVMTTTLGERVRAFVPHPLPPTITVFLMRYLPGAASAASVCASVTRALAA
ncbi:hypothetical protein GTP55_11010 [Duganella sp. FT109W]|uniref:Uncharacterized protein n=1 Tax=Duganella margarita TaxID=2692170 RepID=A0ABW9WHR0_9BURK|nr:hypothetical protein [Duganella margarita]